MNKKLAKIIMFLIFAFLYIPIIYLIVYSFNSGDSMNQFTGFSLNWYRELIHDKHLITIIINTFIIGLLSALIATIFGIVGAFCIDSLKNKRFRAMIEAINSIFIVSPDVIIGISFLLAFTFLRIPLGFWSVLIAHIAFGVPIVVIMILPKLSGIDQNVINAAHDLGASNRQIVQEIIIPLITPAIIAGFLIAFTYSIDDFAVTFFVTGNGFSTLSVDIYAMARQGISLKINALSTIIFILTVSLSLIYYQITMKRVDKNA